MICQKSSSLHHMSWPKPMRSFQEDIKFDKRTRVHYNAVRKFNEIIIYLLIRDDATEKRLLPTLVLLLRNSLRLN
jgi:hypothetical protein